jgi:hypothetical protein
MCASHAAPFQLQPDAFFCRDTRDFNSAVTQIASNHALFEDSVNTQQIS